MDSIGIDIYLIRDYNPSARGDLTPISGIDNLRESIYRRLVTSPGELIHRPNYGVGIRKFLNRPANESNKRELENLIKMNILNEKRITRINSIKCDWSLDVLMIEIRVQVSGVQTTLSYEVMK